MPAKDMYHNVVKNALIKEGWQQLPLKTVTLERKETKSSGPREFLGSKAHKLTL